MGSAAPNHNILRQVIFMAKTNWQDPSSGEILSTHISGLQEAVGKIEKSIGIETVSETSIPLSEVFISNDDRCRIYQAPDNKRNWVISPAPIIKKNGTIISSDFVIDYGGGAVIFTTPILESDVITVDATYTTAFEGKQLSTEDYSTEEKHKLEGIEPQANKYTHPSTHPASMIVLADNTDVETKINEIESDFESHKSETKSYEGKKYKINNPYAKGGSLSLKGQLHCHTTNSDGADTPTALVTAYKEAGYNFITITDHNTITLDPNVPGITWIGTSSEESYERHINAYDIDTIAAGLTNTQDVINLHRANGKLTALNHLNWAWDGSAVSKNIDYDELMKLYDYNFIEIFNNVTNTYAEKQWDWVLSTGRKVFGTATDDCHSITAPSFFSGLSQFNQGWVVVFANSNDKPNILDNLCSGNFYASNGNDILVSVNDNVITASSSAASKFYFIGRNGRILQTNSGTTSASYTIKGDEMYVRVVSTRVSGSKKAWSQPVFIDCMGDDGRQISDIKIPLHGIARQAIINGNFDIWQRGLSATNLAGGSFLADRWKLAVASSGVLPNITHSKQILTSGEISNSLNFYRISVDGAGSSFGAGDSYNISQHIENGTSLLCGFGKKITVTFYARSNIANKRLGINIEQIYGTGGSETEAIKGTAITLSPHWTKYIVTFTTNTLGGKVFGNDERLRLKFYYMWGNDVATNQIGTIGTETFGGVGSIDIAQVQLCAGNEAYPFCPKTYDNERRDCLRYFERIGSPDSIALGTGFCASTTLASIFTSCEALKRIKTPIITADYSQFRLGIGGGISPVTALSFTTTDGRNILINATSSGLASGDCVILQRVDGSTSAWIDIDAEF